MTRRRGEISITFMSGPLDGKTLTFEQPELGETRVITVGRHDTCDIHLTFDNQVSRMHAKIGCNAHAVSETDAGFAAPLSFWLQDVQSRNGTYVEKNPDPIAEQVTLRPGTMFRIGRTWMRLDVPLSF